jgi:hypothetical protein
MPTQQSTFNSPHNLSTSRSSHPTFHTLISGRLANTVFSLARTPLPTPVSLPCLPNAHAGEPSASESASSIAFRLWITTGLFAQPSKLSNLRATGCASHRLWQGGIMWPGSHLIDLHCTQISVNAQQGDDCNSKNPCFEMGMPPSWKVQVSTYIQTN